MSAFSRLSTPTTARIQLIRHGATAASGHDDGGALVTTAPVSPIRNDKGEIIGASKVARDITERSRLLTMAREHAINTEKLGEVGAVVASTFDRDAIIQKVTDLATELTHAEFGAFFHDVTDPESGDAYVLSARAVSSSSRHRRLRPDIPRPRPCSARRRDCGRVTGRTCPISGCRLVIYLFGVTSQSRSSA